MRYEDLKLIYPAQHAENEWNFSNTAMNPSVPQKPKNLLTSVQTGFEVCPASYSLGNGGSFLGDQQAGVRN